MHIQHRYRGRASIMLAIALKMATVSMAVPASAHSPLMTLTTPNLGETSGQSDNDGSAQFMREQLYDRDSNAPTPLQQDVWSQPIGWLFSMTFVLLGSIVAWSKYTQKR